MSGTKVHVDDAISPFIDAEDGLLELLGGPASLNLSRFPELGSLAGSTVVEARSEIGLVDLNLPVEQTERSLFEVPDSTPELEVEAVDTVVGHLHPLGNGMVGEPELKPVEQLQDLGRLKTLPGQQSVGDQAEPLAAPFAPPAPVVQTSVLPRVATPGTPRKVPESVCTQNRPNSCAGQITRKYPTHWHS